MSFVVRSTILLLVAAGAVGPSASTRGACRSDGALSLPSVPEASSVATSRRNPGIVWTINDSGPAELVGVNVKDGTTLRVAVSGGAVQDWEEIAVASCAKGPCIFVADIGDNRRARADIVVYRTLEPAATDKQTLPVEAFRATYPDGPHDAEAIAVLPSGEMFVITKENVASVYRFPANLDAQRIAQLQFVTRLPIRDVTAASVSEDGRFVALRTNTKLFVYMTAAFAKAGAEAANQIDLAGFHEPQGEGIAFGRDTYVYLASEGGGNGAAGVITRLSCDFLSR